MGSPSTRLYVFPEVSMRPLARLVLAHSPSRSATVSVWIVSTPCPRARAGTAHASRTHTARIVLAVFVMSALYPRRVDSESLHAPVKIWSVGLKPPRGIGHVSTCLRERSRDHRSLEAVEPVGQRSWTARGGFTRIAHLFMRARRCGQGRSFFVAIDNEDILHLLTGDLRARMQNRQPLHDVR